MSSPLYRRQLVTGGVNIGLVSAAGAPQNLVGEAIAGIGSAIGEAIAEGKKKEEGLNNDQKKDDSANLSGGNTGSGTESGGDTGSGTESEETGSGTGSGEIGGLSQEIQNRIDAGIPPTANLSAPANTPQNQKKYTDRMAWNELNEKQKALLKKEQGITNFDEFTAAASAWRLKNDPKSENINIATENNLRDNSVGTPYDFIKGITPIKRRGGRRVVNNTARVFSGSSTSGIVQTPGVPTTAFDAGQQSGYTEGRTYTEKMRRMSAPSWMGVGAAAAEGYNMSVDRANYRKQVANDLQDYYEDKFAEFDVDSTGVSDVWNASVQEVSLNLRQDWVNHQKDRDKAISEGRFNEWSQRSQKFKNQIRELKSVNEANKAYQAKTKEDLEKDVYDHDASGPKAVDTILGIATGKGLTGVFRNENGDIMTGGSTPGGLGYVQSVKQYLNGPVKMVPKKNAFDYVAEVTEKFEKMYGDKFVQTQDANGNMIKKPVSMDAIKPYLMRMFDAELDSESIVRAYASVNNWEQDGLDYDNFNTYVKQGKNPKDFVKQKMYEVATQLLNPYQAQREEKVTGISTVREKERIAKDKEERSAETKAFVEQEKEGNLNSLIDFIMQEGEKSYGPDKIVKGDTVIPELKMKKTGADYPGASIIEGAKGVKTTNFNPNTGILTIQPSAAITVKDGSTTVKTKEPQIIDFTKDPIIVRKNLKNLLEQLKITGSINNTRGEQSVTTTTKKSNFRTKYNYN